MQDDDATNKLADLRAKLADLTSKASDIKLNADDRQAASKLLGLKAKLADLGDRTADIKIKTSGVARAEADMAAVSLDMDKLKAKADADNAGLLSRLLLGARGQLGGLVGGIPGLGGVGGSIAGDAEGAAGAGGSSPGGAGVMGGVIAALVAASPAIVTELTGLVSGFAAAGAGAGAFALLAYPAIKQVTGALGDTQAQLLKLPLMEQDAVGDLQQLTGTWQQMSKAFQPQAFKVFTDFLELADELLPDVTPFATTFAASIDGLLKKADSFAASKGFTDWLAQFQKLEGPSITAIGTGIGHLVTNFGKLLTLMSAKDVVNSINIAFSVIDGALIGFMQFVHYSMVTWDALTTAWDKGTAIVRATGHDIAAGFDVARRAAVTAGNDIATGFDVARHGVATGAHAIAGAFDATRHGAATAGHDTASAFDVMRNRVATALDGDLDFVKSHWKAVASFLVNPVATAVFEVRTHLHQIAQEFDSLRHDSASILAGMRHDIASAFDGARHDASAAAAGMRHDVASAFDSARHDTASTMAGLRHDTASVWDGVRHDAAAWGNDMIHAVTSAWDSIFGSSKKGGGEVTGEVGKLPGQITGLLAKLPGEMLTIGRNVIDGLIHGIESSAADIPGIMKSLAGEVESYFTDPLKIFSPSRVMFEHGQQVPAGVALGIEAGLPRIRQAAAAMARTAAAPLAPGAAGVSGAASGANHMVIQINGDANLRQWLKKSIRVTGGNVQVVGA